MTQIQSQILTKTLSENNYRFLKKSTFSKFSKNRFLCFLIYNEIIEIYLECLLYLSV